MSTLRPRNDPSVQDGLRRHCCWPACERFYAADTGPLPEVEGGQWMRRTQLGWWLLCPDHHRRGHQPQPFDWDPDTEVLRARCECGAASGDLWPTTQARAAEWWREHVADVVAIVAGIEDGMKRAMDRTYSTEQFTGLLPPDGDG